MIILAIASLLFSAYETGRNKDQEYFFLILAIVFFILHLIK